jgi:hypothetical protein
MARHAVNAVSASTGSAADKRYLERPAIHGAAAQGSAWPYPAVRAPPPTERPRQLPEPQKPKSTVNSEITS